MKRSIVFVFAALLIILEGFELLIAVADFGFDFLNAVQLGLLVFIEDFVA